MIKLYYTGASTYLTKQSLVTSSLGGFVSNSAIPNSIDNSIFGDLGESNIWQVKPNYQLRGLFGQVYYFEGEQSYDKINLKINFNYQEGAFEELNLPENFLQKIRDSITFQIGLGPISILESDKESKYMESVQSEDGIPYYFTHDFVNLVAGEEIKFENVNTSGFGIWIRRKFDPRTNLQVLFDYKSDYWLNNDNIPSIDFPFEIKLDIENII